MKDRTKRESKKNNPLGALITVGILLFASVSEGGEMLFVLAPLVCIGIFAVVIILVGKAVKKAGKPGTSPAFKGYAPKREKGLEDMGFQPRHAEAVREYSEYAAEENFLRDKQRRIDQLDEFLKNGIIEKDEYRLLKERYSK